ncbi:unnamed protein product [Pleuronectes platessa]|uniref:HAT C-terminal dimerisation domain-containing protein n=1 Tax=Pleuronectes platessa TaxID=8262 RepID=A0A9N7UDL2_PLEPL|nr:unnamed protein product [Pleuronectes platessa]
MNRHLSDSVVITTVGHTDTDDSVPPHKTLKRPLLNILDRAITELETRFCQKNLELMKATSSLVPTSGTFLHGALLHPLVELAGTDAGCLNNEILVAKPMLLKECPNEPDLSTVCKTLQHYKAAFPLLYKLYITALVIGVSSAACESSFSTLSRVLTPFRRTMLHHRKRNLVILAHEKSITYKLDMDEICEGVCQGKQEADVDLET